MWTWIGIAAGAIPLWALVILLARIFLPRIDANVVADGGRTIS